MRDCGPNTDYDFCLEDLARMVINLAVQLQSGCGNCGCHIRRPVGMATTAVCQCRPKRISHRLLDLAILTERMGDNWRKRENGEDK